MTLDFNNLTIEQVKSLNKLNVEIQPRYNDLITHFINRTDKKIGYLVSITASRNMYQGKLYINTLFLLLAKKYTVENKIKKIVFPNKILKNVFTSNYEKDFEIEYHQKSYIFKLLIKNILQDGLMSFRMFFSKDKARKKNISLKKKYILIDTFILSNSIKSGKYIDRYYNGLLDYVTDKTRYNIYFLPEILGSYNRKDIQKIASNSVENILFKQDFLRLSDYVAAFCQLLKLRFPKNEKFIIDGFDVSPLIKHEFFTTRFNPSSFAGVLNYYFIKRLKEKNVKLKLVIDWNENQPIDKGLIKGVREFYPETYIKGYQGYIISTDFNFYIQPTEIEVNNGVIPDEICVVGDGLQKRMKQFTDKVKVTTAPALRFNGVYVDYLIKKEKSSKVLLVALPIGYNESYFILDILIQCVHVFHKKGYIIKIKPHPVLNIQKIKLKLQDKWPKEFQVIEGDFNQILTQSDLLIGSTSTTLLESLSRGIPVVVIGSQNGITQNPIPSYINNNFWKLCYTKGELINSVEILFEFIQKNKVEVINLSKKIKQEYFKKPTKELVLQFLSKN